MSFDENGNREHSAVFTPMGTARDMAASFPAESVGLGRQTLDPCCGSGNLLVALVERRLAMGISKPDIAKTTHGYDVQKHYVDQCRDRIVALLGEDNRKTIEDNIRIKDFLWESTLFDEVML